MSTAENGIAQRTVELLRTLPPQRAQAALDFVEHLAQKTADEQWEKRLDSAADSPRFRAMAEQIERDIADGQDETMDVERL